MAYSLELKFYIFPSIIFGLRRCSIKTNEKSSLFILITYLYQNCVLLFSVALSLIFLAGMLYFFLINSATSILQNPMEKLLHIIMRLSQLSWLLYFNFLMIYSRYNESFLSGLLKKILPFLLEASSYKNRFRLLLLPCILMFSLLIIQALILIAFSKHTSAFLFCFSILQPLSNLDVLSFACLYFLSVQIISSLIDVQIDQAKKMNSKRSLNTIHKSIVDKQMTNYSNDILDLIEEDMRKNVLYVKEITEKIVSFFETPISLIFVSMLMNVTSDITNSAMSLTMVWHERLITATCIVFIFVLICMADFLPRQADELLSELYTFGAINTEICKRKKIVSCLVTYFIVGIQFALP